MAGIPCLWKARLLEPRRLPPFHLTILLRRMLQMKHSMELWLSCRYPKAETTSTGGRKQKYYFQHHMKGNPLMQTISLLCHPTKTMARHRLRLHQSVADHGPGDVRILFTTWGRAYKGKSKTATTNKFKLFVAFNVAIPTRTLSNVIPYVIVDPQPTKTIPKFR